MYFITSIMLYAHKNQRRIRSIVDKSLVHCHRGCEFEPRHSTMLFFFIFFIDYLLSRGM